jgi:alanyl-tRNA synthetase
MTERLYYTDPYRTHFTAHVVERLTWPGPHESRHPAVILDRTAFYPTSGGQPADRGKLGNATVLDVVEGEANGPSARPIVHLLSDPVKTDEVVGEIDWQRRFDHMQQHTGQHILSAAFEQVLDAATVGFHLGATSSTIDVDAAHLQMEDALPVEAAANEVVWDDRPVSIRFVDIDTVTSMPMADPPPDVEGPIRLIQIPGPLAGRAAGTNARTEAAARFDVNPCGGTHVARTGEIGVIKIVGVEHRGDKTRIEFLCGRRALRDYEARRSMTTALARTLTVGTGELHEAVERLRAENKDLRHTERKLRQRLLDMESTQMVEKAATHGPYRVVGAVWQGRRPDELRTLARKLAEQRDVVALLFSVDGRTHFCFARAEGLNLDVNQLLQEACAQLDGKGGGRPQVAQGSAPGASVDQVKRVLRSLERALEGED